MFLYLLCVILFASALVQTAPTESTAINFNDESILSTVSEPVTTLKPSVVNETINLATKTSEAQTLDSSLEYTTVSRNVESSGEIITETPEASPAVFKTDTDEIVFIDTATPVDDPIVSTLKPYAAGATIINPTEISNASTIISKIHTNGETAAETTASGAQTNLYTIKPMSNEEISNFTSKITTEASQASSSAEISTTPITQAPTIFSTSESTTIETSTFTPEKTTEAQIDFSTSKSTTDDVVTRLTTESITEKPTTEAPAVFTTSESTTTKISTLISELSTEEPTTEAQIDFSTPKSTTDDMVTRLTTESITEKPTTGAQTVPITQQSTTEITTSTFSSELTTDSPTTEAQIDFSTSKPTTDDIATRITTESITEKPTTDIKTSTVISEFTTETPTTEVQTSFTSEPTTNIKTTSFTPEITTEILETSTTQPEATTNAIPTELTLAEIFIKILQALSQSSTSQPSKTPEASTPPSFTYTPYNYQFVLKSRTTNSCNWYQVKCTNYSPFDNNNYCTYTLIGDCNEYKPYQILATHQIVQPSYYSYLFNYQYIYQQQSYHQCNLYQVRCVFYSLTFDQFDYCNNEYLGSCSS